MKKVIIFIILLFAINDTFLLQARETKKSAFQFTFFTPVGTQGTQAPDYSNKVSVNLLVGVSKNEESFTLGGLANIIRHDASGCQIAGLSNVIGNNAKGFQLAGISNTVGNNGHGMLLSGILNTSKEYEGSQISGVLNVASHIKGFQLDGITNIAKNVKGFQIAGIGNVAKNVKGFQIAGVENVAKDVNGFQIFGIGNVARNINGFQISGIGIVTKNVNGFQIAEIGNVAKDVNGFQIAGIGNVANDVKSFQIASIFNKARNVKGFQFAGILNIADNCDYPIGLINLIKNGEKGIGVSFNELSSTVLSFRSGGKVMYGIVGLGYNYRSISKESVIFQTGIGVHINYTPSFRINTELISNVYTLFRGDVTSQISFAVLPAYKFASHIEIFGGPSFNFMQSDSFDNEDIFPGDGSINLWKKRGSSHLEQGHIGFIIGTQFLF